MGRSRGGLTAKIHALVDARGLPIKLKLTPGQAHDGTSAVDTRFEKHSANYLALVKLAAVRVWIRSL